MNEDIFTIKELREIILAFPQSRSDIADEGASKDALPSLVNAASGNALLLGDGLRKQLLKMLQQADHRLVLSMLSQQLDIGSKDLLSLLAEPEIRVLWCYNAGIHTIIPPIELYHLFEDLQDACSTRFVDFQGFCQKHDLHGSDFREQLRRANASKAESLQLGIGKWFDNASSTARGTEYIYTFAVLEGSRSAIRGRLQQANENCESITLPPDEFRGLDQQSYLCFSRKVLDSLFDYNGDYVNKCLLTMGDNGLEFIPWSAVTRGRTKRMKKFFRESHDWINSDRRSLTDLPCLFIPVSLDGFNSMNDSSMTFEQGVEVAGSIDAGTKLVPVYHYAVTDIALVALSERLIQLLESSKTSALWLSKPREVEFRDNEAFLSELQERLVAPRAPRIAPLLDPAQVIALERGHRRDLGFALKPCFDTIQKELPELIKHSAIEVWKRYATAPNLVAFEQVVAGHGLQKTMADLIAQKEDPDLYRRVLKSVFDLDLEEEGRSVQTFQDKSKHSKELKHALGIWSKGIWECDGENLGAFAAEYVRTTIWPLYVNLKAVQTFSAGSNRRNTLAERLLNFITRDGVYLLAHIQGLHKGDYNMCGRVPGLINGLHSKLSNFPKSESPERDVEKAIDLYRFKSATEKSYFSKEPTPQEFEDTKAGMINEHISIAKSLNAKRDKDGSKTFLLMVVISWARHNDGVIYGEGRDVPRLLTSLKAKLGDAVHARLEELMDAVRKGGLTDEQRQEVLAFL